MDCTLGRYCASEGLDIPTGACDAGFLCRRGAVAADGRVSSSMHALPSLCPEGSFCPEGALAPVPCFPGSYSNKSGLQSASQCLSCLAGFMCSSPGTVFPEDPCIAGYYCPEGSAASTVPCPLGHSCPRGSTYPALCPPGMW